MPTLRVTVTSIEVLAKSPSTSKLTRLYLKLLGRYSEFSARASTSRCTDASTMGSTFSHPRSDLDMCSVMCSPDDVTICLA